MALDAGIAVGRLIVELGEVPGRKRLQKIVHLLQESGAAEFRYRFILHYFGPFSRELASDLDFLRAAGLLKEEPPAEGDGAYVYSASGKEASERICELYGGARSQPDWAQLAERLNNEATPLLEALSTVVFLARRGRQGEQLGEEFTAVKPGLKERFEEAVSLGEELRLLQV